MADTNGKVIYVPALKWKQGEHGVVSMAVGSCVTADASTTNCFKAGTEKATLAALQSRVDALTTDCTLLTPKPFSWIP